MKMSKNKFKRKILFSLLAILSGSANAIINIGDSGATDTLFTGAPAYHGGNLGQSVASGDFNGDGIADLVLGAPGMTSPRGTGEEGRVFIYYGGATTGVGVLADKVTTQDGSEDLLFYGVNARERAGEMLVSGDLNGDGFDDLIIVAQAGNKDHHKIYVIYGSARLADGSLADADVTITRTTHAVSTWPNFTVSAIITGDLNNDRIDDLILSDKVNNKFEVLLGTALKWSASLDLDADSDITYLHSLDTDLFGDDYFPLHNGANIAGVAVGDMNGDGNNDLVMGFPNETASVLKSGRLYLIPGTGTNFGSKLLPVEIDKVANVVRIDGALPQDRIGGPLAMGNVNGDANNMSDLIIGQPRSMQGIVNSTGFGQAQILLGKANLPVSIDLYDDAASTLRIKRKADEGGLSTIGFYTGTSVLADDINGDGIADITIASPGASFTSNHGHGWVHTVYGAVALASEYLLANDADLWILTPEPTDPLASGHMGSSMVVADFDNDGKADIAMGAPTGGADGTVTSGYVPLLLAASTKVGCSGEYVTVSDSFAASPSPHECEGDLTLVTSGNVTVANGATVHFRSPAINLKEGFRVASGGVFSANNL